MKTFSQVLETAAISSREGLARSRLDCEGLGREKDRELSTGVLHVHLQRNPSSSAWALD